MDDGLQRNRPPVGTRVVTRDQLQPATVVEHDNEPGHERRVRIEFDNGQLSWFDCRTLTPVETKMGGMNQDPDPNHWPRLPLGFGRGGRH